MDCQEGVNQFVHRAAGAPYPNRRLRLRRLPDMALGRLGFLIGKMWMMVFYNERGRAGGGLAERDFVSSQSKKSTIIGGFFRLAEREGFEPSRDLRPNPLSKRAP